MPEDSLAIRIRLLERALTYYEKEGLEVGKNDSVIGGQERQLNWELARLRKRVGVVGGAVDNGVAGKAKGLADEGSSLTGKGWAV